MQEVDPPVQIEPSVLATYEAAQVQAEAAIRAAEMGAQAAWDAAMLQVSIGVPAAIIAAGAALIAGRWAYQAAIRAAQNQTELENSKHKAKISAYIIMQRANIAVLDNITNDQLSGVKGVIGKCLYDLKVLEGRVDYKGKIVNGHKISIYDFNEPEEWREDKWENHALLGSDFVNYLVNSRRKLNLMKDWQNFMIETSDGNVKNKNVYYFPYINSIKSGNEINPTKESIVDMGNFFEVYSDLLVGFSKSLEVLLQSIPSESR